MAAMTRLERAATGKSICQKVCLDFDALILIVGGQFYHRLGEKVLLLHRKKIIQQKQQNRRRTIHGKSSIMLMVNFLC